MSSLFAFSLSDWQTWLIIALVLGAIELMSMSFFLIWPAITALIMTILTLLFPEVSWIAQIVIFSLISVIMIIPGRRMILPMMKSSDNEQLNERSAQFIGQTGKIMSGEAGHYRIKIGDSEWSARSNDPLEKGAHVRITKVDGIILSVKKI